MKKWIIILILMVVMSFCVSAAICENRLTVGSSCTILTPPIACSTNYSIFNQTNLVENGEMVLINSSIYSFNFSQNQGDYVIILCDNTSREIRVTSEDQDMSSLSITIFIMGLVIGLYYLAFKIVFSENEILQWSIKNSIIIIATFLLTLSTSMIATIADTAGIALTSEIFRFMWIINWACYIFMVFVFIKFLLKLIKLMHKNAKEKRGLHHEE